MKKDEKMINIVNTINGSLGLANNDEKENDFQEKELQEKFLDKSLSSISDANSVKSTMTHNTQKSLTSGYFKEELVLDLPNYSSTKYTNHFAWKIFNLLTYLIYSLVLLFSSFSWILRSDNFNTIHMVSHLFLIIHNCMNWIYYQRGCLTQSNYNSHIKSNVDKSLKARILRGETGWIYFFAFIGSIILFYGNILYLLIKGKKITFEIYEIYNINFVGSMIISVTQILKIDKTLIETRQYLVKNDLQRSLVEICLFFGSLFFGCSYLIQNMYNFQEKDFFVFLGILKFFGNGFILASSIFLLYRYLCAGKDDLNTSNVSDYTT